MSARRYQRILTTLSRRQPDLTVVMDDVHKPNNLAAIARTCDAVGVGEVHAVSSDPHVRLVQRQAQGTQKWVNIKRHKKAHEVIEALRENGFCTVATVVDDRAVDYATLDLTQSTALVVGSEMDGLAPDTIALCDKTAYIPMRGMIDSLNVSVATALILFEARRQRETAGFYREKRLDEATFKRLAFEWMQPKVAAYCQKHGLNYPSLDDDGDIVEPLTDVANFCQP